MPSKKSFEDRMDELQQIVLDLEKNEIPLEEALSIFEKSQKLISDCEKDLKSAETKLKKLVKKVDEKGNPQLDLI